MDTYIRKVTMEGFKSFKRKVAIPLLPGFTVLTGPNGAGKSNLSEAVSFVFGLQSRAMRARKAEELIFHGSKSKPASDHAKVAVYFDNSKKTLPLEEEEVVIGRKINKAVAKRHELAE